MIYAYATIPLENPSDPKAPITHLRDWFEWDCYLFAWVGALTTWIGDVLVVSPILIGAILLSLIIFDP